MWRQEPEKHKRPRSGALRRACGCSTSAAGEAGWLCTPRHYGMDVVAVTLSPNRPSGGRRRRPRQGSSKVDLGIAPVRRSTWLGGGSRSSERDPTAPGAGGEAGQRQQVGHANAPGLVMLQFVPALSRPDLLSPPLQSWPRADVRVAPIDATLTDAAPFCASYDVPLDRTANCVVLAEARRCDGAGRHRHARHDACRPQRPGMPTLRNYAWLRR